MTLEDRIRNTGEHLLGSLDANPDLPQRIHHRIERRAHQRRQRAAAGLGAGVVVVLGGLVVLNVGDRTGEAPTVAQGASSPDLTSLPTTLSLAAPTEAVEAPTPTVPAPPTTTTPAEAPISVEAARLFEPIPGAPKLYAARAGETLEIDLGAGTMATALIPGEPPPSMAGRPEDGSVFDLDRSVEADACGQHPVVALGPSGVALPGFPTAAHALTVSRNGATGLVRYIDCAASVDPVTVTDPGVVADPAVTESSTETTAAPPSTPVWRVATFRTADPAASLTTVDGAAWGELSDDGRFLLLEDADGPPLSVLDLDDGDSTTIVPEGCTGPTADPDVGYLVGDGGVAFLAWCDGTLSLITGSVDEPRATRQFSDCEGNAALAVLDPEAADVAATWVAVTDREHQIAWVAHGEVQSGPIPGVERVAWYPLAAD